MLNVTYLFGAGASCYCLPTYANFRQRFDNFYWFIVQYKNMAEKGQIDLPGGIGELEKIIDGFRLEFKYHSTPDTIAKKYFHTFGKTKELWQLKAVLILFFIYEQTKNIEPKASEGENDKHTVDKRYDAFIAAALKPKKGEIEIIPNINVLTWNYDLQFEIAYINYVQRNFLEVQAELQCYPKTINTYRVDYNSDKFSIIHLNGIAYSKPKIDTFKDIIGNVFASDQECIKYLLDVYIWMTIDDKYLGGPELLSFAWENTNEDFTPKEDEKILLAKEVAQKTNVLVINGYSFPNFNRVIDAEILNSMYSLEKVYIQSPQAEEIGKIVKDIRQEPVIVESVGYWHQFYVPDWRKYSSLPRGLDFVIM